MENILCFTCGTVTSRKVSAEQLNQMFTIEKYGEDNSNKRHKSEDVAQNFENFIFDCEGMASLLLNIND